MVSADDPAGHPHPVDLLGRLEHDHGRAAPAGRRNDVPRTASSPAQSPHPGGAPRRGGAGPPARVEVDEGLGAAWYTSSRRRTTDSSRSSSRWTTRPPHASQTPSRRRGGLHVARGPPGQADAASGDPPDHLVVVDQDGQDQVEREAQLLEPPLEGLGLGDVPGEPVQDEPLPGPLEGLDDHGHHDVVGTSSPADMYPWATDRARSPRRRCAGRCPPSRSGPRRIDRPTARPGFPCPRPGGPSRTTRIYRRKPS